MFSKLNLEETLAGKIVLSIASDRISENQIFESLNTVDFENLKQKLAQLHFHKIDLADEILVVNVDGYVGKSTTREIQYALQKGKNIRWLEPEHMQAHFKSIESREELNHG